MTIRKPTYQDLSTTTRLEKVEGNITLAEFKKLYPEFTGYVYIAAEDIPGGFGRKGWSLYGDCEDMLVKATEPTWNPVVLKVFLGVTKC